MAIVKKKLAKGRHMSSIKRNRQASKRRARNKQILSRIKTAVKKVRQTKSKDELKKAVPLIAKAATKGVVHKKTASRLISRLTKHVGA